MIVNTKSGFTNSPTNYVLAFEVGCLQPQGYNLTRAFTRGGIARLAVMNVPLEWDARGMECWNANFFCYFDDDDNPSSYDTLAMITIMT
jgi:hypothetical protein